MSKANASRLTDIIIQRISAYIADCLSDVLDWKDYLSILLFATDDERSGNQKSVHYQDLAQKYSIGVND
ncbi:hypothetical protein BX661DRAFT_197062 [Kickxella alabastrina]|uniref:uncharacterized protein n=1 Tax=Kickxella alabastrina TaxID=61397 RepID=UPI00221E52FA|nr:uncharacterized protein BX661DRAFT_197062 [Kickxella alabastrina]KAI7831833.1 hypothetical protein BX661DRAFT_197062 [Kickxella alabastrina]